MAQNLLIDSSVLEAHQKMIHYGIMGEALVEAVKVELVARKAFDMPEAMPIELDDLGKLQRDSLLCPPAFKECKLPSAKGLFGSSGDDREKPLFDQAVRLRKTVIPLMAMKKLLDVNETSPAHLALVKRLCDEMLDDAVEQLQLVNYKRLVVKVPNKEARGILLASEDDMVRDPAVLAALERTKKVQKSSDAMRKGWKSRVTERKTNTTPADASQAASSTDKAPTKSRGGWRGKNKRG